MRITHPRTIYRKDYRPPAFSVETVEMGMDLDPEKTIVATRMNVHRRQPGPLVLYGEELDLLFIEIDGQRLSPRQYIIDEQSLTIGELPDRCTLDVAVRIVPANNTMLMGLYVSNGGLFTQCEAEGFRKICYFPDRPDVMARFTVMLRANREQFPVLLSNGNLIAHGDLGDGRHFATWHDPFPKPSYLFALVAARLSCLERHVRTQSGREVLLQIYAEQRDLPKVGHAMDALTHAMRWDEKRFGLELDLDRFMIVAVSDFNMGAMENKGLNIFNAKYVLATPETATDSDFFAIESVVGHEYFHNWTGNRVTCRDWFQLTLKEGLTVFRDQEFSADLAAGYLDEQENRCPGETSRAVQRIDNVRSLRVSQFPEDAGPMAHPIRPESYQEIGNFYTATVYEKGAEVIRMQQTLLGREGFRAGMDEYFLRYDGHAVTCDDFVAAMESIYKRLHPGRDLSRFRNWYSQAGTPRVTANGDYDAQKRTYTLSLKQSCPKVGVERRTKQDKLPFHIPFAVGLLNHAGADLPLDLREHSVTAETRELPTTMTLDVTEWEHRFVFHGVTEKPVPSLLRGFSAPVIVEFPYSDEELAHLSAHDNDPFNRWHAGQRLASQEIVRLSQHALPQSGVEIRASLLAVYQAILSDTRLDPALQELALTLPSENEVGEELPVYDPACVHAARLKLHCGVASGLEQHWLRAYESNQTPGAYHPNSEAAGKRALKNCALKYLVDLDGREGWAWAWRQFTNAQNMTDRLGALVALVNSGAPQRKQALAAFYERFKDEPLVVDKWLRVQATARRVDVPVIEIIRTLMRHPAFSLRNPNKVYSLLVPFFNSNPAEFHRADGEPYELWTETVLELDAINPAVASRVARSLNRWKKLPGAQQAHAQKALSTIHSTTGLSKDVAEIVDKALRT